MIYHIIDEKQNVLFTNTKQDCIECIAVNANTICHKLVCPQDGEDKRVGSKLRQNMTLYLCSNCKATKTSSLFKEKIDFLSYSVPSMLHFKAQIEQVVRNEEREKYSKIVHNLKTLNGQSLLSQYKFIPQEAFADNYDNLFAIVLAEVEKRPKDATVALLKQSKNNEHMKTEFSTHEKLSIDSPSLFIQNHIVRKVILNVYHSFDMDFRNRYINLKIDECEHKAKFDYDTIRVAIFHIFSNAIKYMAEKSQLCVNITSRDEYICIDFCMRSFFIFSDEVEAIFNDHCSGKIAYSQKLNGSGLGMGLIKKALNLNGGSIIILPGEKKIKVCNIDYGDNIFRITLPINK